MNEGTKKTERFPSEEDKRQAVNLILNRLEQASVFYFWVRYVQPMIPKNSDFQHYIEAVKNACLQSTLICIRDLDDFFATGKSRKGDVRAQDFIGYKSQGRFLTDQERDEIRQRIVHLTYHPVWKGTTGIAPDKNLDWNTIDLVGKALRPAFGFMGYLVRALSKDDPDQAGSIQRIKEGFEYRLKNMESVARDAVVAKE